MERGVIEIDGVNIARLRLRDLRSSLSIIPQVPACLSVLPDACLPGPAWSCLVPVLPACMCSVCNMYSLTM